MTASPMEQSKNIESTGASIDRQTLRMAVREADSRTLKGIQIALAVLASIAALWALQWGAVFLVPCIVAISMTFWLMPMVDWLAHRRIPHSVGAAVVLLGLIGAIGGTGYVLRDDAREFAASLPLAAKDARKILNEAARDPNGLIHNVRSVFSDRTPVGTRARPLPVENAQDIQEVVVRGSTTAIAAAANVGVILFTLYLMLASGDLFRRKLVTVVAHQAPVGTLTRKRVTIEILNEIAAQFRRYLAVLFLTNVIIGVLTWAAFAALGVEHAAVWGIAAAVLHIIPYVGPAVVTGGAFLITASQFDSLSQALIVATAALTVFITIGMILQTWLSGRASRMNAVAVFTSLIFWGWLWGIPGLLLGTPLTMAVKVVADRIECLHWLAIFLADAPKRERKTVAEEAIDPAKVPEGSPASTMAEELDAHDTASPALIAATTESSELVATTRDVEGQEEFEEPALPIDDHPIPAKLFVARPFPA